MIPRPPLSGISPPLGWVARYTVEEEPDGMWVALLAVWALMQYDEGNTWVAGIEPTGAGDDGQGACCRTRPARAGRAPRLSLTSPATTAASCWHRIHRPQACLRSCLIAASPAPHAGIGTLLPVAHPSDLEARLAALEARVEEVAADAAAARHLAAARDRDLADLGVKVDANRAAVNALGVQTAGRFDRLEQRVDRLEEKVDGGFTEMRGKLDQAAAGQQQIVDLLTGLISGQGDQ